MHSLPSGAVLPMCGLGTFKSKGVECTAACLAGLRAGYRLIDTARVYRNEAEVGAALQQSDVPREDVFITSKIPPTEQGEDAAYAAVLDSLAQLRVSYLDLVLIHWPGKAKTPLDSPANREARRGSWKALIRARWEGLVRDIGVSNFTAAHLEDPCFQPPASHAHAHAHAHSGSSREEALGRETCMLPAVNQVECHPLCLQQELREYCRRKGIVLQAYSSMCCGDAAVYGHPDLLALLSRVQVASAGVVRTPQQLLLMWGLQRGFSVIPKSASAARLTDNWVFMQLVLQSMQSAKQLEGAPEGEGGALPALPEDCLASLRGEGGEDRHLCWDPRRVL